MLGIYQGCDHYSFEVIRVRFLAHNREQINVIIHENKAFNDRFSIFILNSPNVRFSFLLK